MNVEEVIRGSDGIEKTMAEIDCMKNQMKYSMEAKNIATNAQITLYSQD